MNWNLVLAVLNALCVPMNLAFYFYGDGNILNLVCIPFNAGVAGYCAAFFYRYGKWSR